MTATSSASIRQSTRRTAAGLLALACATWLTTAPAQTVPAPVSPATGVVKPRIDKAADVPRFVYKVDGKLEDIVRSPERFAALAVLLRRDVELVLQTYDIPDKATRRGLLNQLAILDYLDGRYPQALARTEDIRALEDKPADKLLSGLRLRVLATAAQQQSAGSDAWRRAAAERLAAELAALPFDTVANDVRELKASSETLGETLALGRVREVMQPIVTRTGEISSDFTPALISARYRLVALLPAKPMFIDGFGAYLDQHKVVKQDIWAARDVALAAGDKSLTTVRLAVWDSGVDTALFKPQLLRGANGQPAFIAYDKYSKPSTQLLVPLPADVRSRLPQMLGRTKGFSDLQSNIDSAESGEVKRWLSELAPDQYKTGIEELNLIGNYEHGTHVAGIALAGNPAAKLVVARIEFGSTLLPDPCPSLDQAQRDAASVKATVAYLKRQKVRVVNMSWGGDVGAYERDLESCGIGKTPDERKAQARVLFDIQKKSLTDAFASAPEILFVAAAGNSNNDPGFVEDVPAAIVLPNMLTVGAVDLAGDEAGFTSYGSMVAVHANGYQVESYLPGGKRVALSGTSMAAPQATNLAAKLLAVNPKLTPQQLKAIIVETGDRSADGRRNLMNPKKAVERARQQKA